jgi:hypothetical protein
VLRTTFERLYGGLREAIKEQPLAAGALALLLCVCLGAVVAFLILAPAPQSSTQEAFDVATGPPSADCTQWTDRCRTCMRQPNGQPTCSNVAIACTPTAKVCLSKTAPSADPAKPAGEAPKPAGEAPKPADSNDQSTPAAAPAR